MRRSSVGGSPRPSEPALRCCSRSGSCSSSRSGSRAPVRLRGTTEHQQATMLEAAEDYRWSVRELRDQVQPDVPAPEPLPRFARSAFRLKKVLDSKGGLQDLDRVHELDADQREDLQAIAAALRERADAIERALSDR